MSFAPLPLSELAAAFRQQGEGVARYAPEAAKAFDDCAAWLEASLGAELEKPLTLEQAVRETGWSYEGLRRRLKEEPELNAGHDGAPLVRRCDLPRLGAPRGPRGKYRRRKAKSTAAPESASEDASLSEGGCSTATTDGPDDMAARAAGDGIVEPGAPATPSCAPVEEVNTDVDSVEDDLDAAVVQTTARGTTWARRAHSMPRGTRRASSKERFNEIRALAARG